MGPVGGVRGLLVYGVLTPRWDIARGGVGALVAGIALFLVGFLFFEGVLGLDGRPTGDLAKVVVQGALVFLGLLVIVGAFMVVWWISDIRRGALMRPDRSRPEIMLHLAAELVTAALLAAWGGLLLAGGTAGVALAGLGALGYTVIASPGYFLARRERAPVIMFAVLFALTATAIGGLLAM